MTTQQVTTPAPTSSTPPSDPDAAKYEALRKELGIEAEGDEADPPEPAEPPAEPAGKTEPPEPAESPVPDHVPRTEHENVQRALRQAREEAQAARAEKAAILQIIEQARAAQRQPPAAKEPDKPKIPDVTEDPIGHFKALNEQLVAKIDALEKGGSQTTEQLQAQVQHQQLLGLVQQSEAAILDAKNPQAKPDYWEACTYLEGQRERELVRMYPDNNLHVQQYAMQQGYRSAAELRMAVLNSDRWAVAVQALQMGVSPAEFYYSLATDRGYQPKAKPNGDGKDKGQKQIEAAKKGRAAAISISGGDGGRKGAQDMSLSDLADLSIEDPDAFDKAWEDMRKLGRLG